MRTGVPGRRDIPGRRAAGQMGTFVKINYAYDEGFDVINKLTDEYATEHNVQNPPLES